MMSIKGITFFPLAAEKAALSFTGRPPIRLLKKPLFLYIHAFKDLCFIVKLFKKMDAGAQLLYAIINMINNLGN